MSPGRDFWRSTRLGVRAFIAHTGDGTRLRCGRRGIASHAAVPHRRVRKVRSNPGLHPDIRSTAGARRPARKRAPVHPAGERGVPAHAGLLSWPTCTANASARSASRTQTSAASRWRNGSSSTCHGSPASLSRSPARTSTACTETPCGLSGRNEHRWSWPAPRELHSGCVRLRHSCHSDARIQPVSRHSSHLTAYHGMLAANAACVSGSPLASTTITCQSVVVATP